MQLIRNVAKQRISRLEQTAKEFVRILEKKGKAKALEFYEELSETAQEYIEKTEAYAHKLYTAVLFHSLYPCR
jgi:RNase P subunit RPR2